MELMGIFSQIVLTRLCYAYTLVIYTTGECFYTGLAWSPSDSKPDLYKTSPASVQTMRYREILKEAGLLSELYEKKGSEIHSTLRVQW